MSIFLVQHGKSLPKDKDPREGLSEEGRAEVLRIADVAAGYGVCPTRIDHSVKHRARQTAELMAAALNPPEGLVEKTGLKPMDDVTAVARKLTGGDHLMLVGHLPFMERITAFLITGQADKPVFKFQNGGIVCLDQDPRDRHWTIRWALMPNID